MAGEIQQHQLEVPMYRRQLKAVFYEVDALQRSLPVEDEALAPAMGPKADITMAAEIDLNIAEVPYESRAVTYRYSRFI